MASIRQLGGYIAKSETFLVMAEHGYLERLWCMYELAVFAAANKFSFDTLQTVQLDAIRWVLFLYVFQTVNNIVAVPIMCLLFGGTWWNTWILGAVPNVLWRFVVHVGVYTCLLSGTVMVPMYVLYHVLKDADEQHQMLMERVRHFSVDSLRCTVEADREFVLSEIRKTFGDYAAFEKFVVDWLWPDFMERQYGRSRSSIVSYRLFLVAQLPHMIVGLDFFLVTWVLQADSGERGCAVCTLNLWVLGFTFVWIPLATRLSTAVIIWVQGLHMQSETAKKAVAIGLATFVYALLSAFNVAISHPDLPQGPMAAANMCMAIIVWYTW
jgi:hypothetical protein